MTDEKVLLLDNYRHTLVVLRSLTAAGWTPVVGFSETEGDDRRQVLASRFAGESWKHPPLTSEPEFVEALSAYLKDHPEIRVVFPVGENSLSLLARTRSELPDHVLWMMPAPETTLNCLDKFYMCRLVEKLDIPAPRTRRVRSFDELAEFVASFGLPIVLKAEDSFSFVKGRKALFLESESDVDEARDVFLESRAVIAQERARGIRHNCMFHAQNGNITAYFESEILRTDVWDGSGYGVESRSLDPSSQRRQWCERLIDHLDYDGIGCVQFLVDEHDNSTYLEINPRMDATAALPYRCGIAFPVLGVEGKMGSESSSGSYPVGIRIHWLYGDLRGWVKAVSARSISAGQALAWLGAIVRALVLSRHHMTFSWTDPAPTLVAYAELATKLIRGSGKEPEPHSG